MGFMDGMDDIDVGSMGDGGGYTFVGGEDIEGDSSGGANTTYSDDGVDSNNDTAANEQVNEQAGGSGDPDPMPMSAPVELVGINFDGGWF
jgi:hypothetical protein